MKIIQEKLWSKAVELMPRGTQTMSKCPDQFVDGVYPKFVRKAKGAYLWDIDGNKYLDFMCGLGPIILGYNHKRTNDAVINQIKDGIIFSLPTLLEQKLAQLIVDTIPCAEQVRFAKNGTDADLAAVRIARSYTNKEKIVKCGYHGWGDWHGITLRPYGIPSSLKEIIDEFEYNNLDSLEKLLNKGDVAGVIMEAQALTAPEPGFLEGVRELCTKYKALLIFDEVVTGYRWSLGGAQEYYGVIPDLCCIGKSMANGMPISAIAGKKKYMQELNYIFFSMTFGGECLSLAASIETIEELKEKDFGHIWKLGDMFDKGIKENAKKYGLNINFAGSAPRHNLTFDESYEDPNGMKALFYQEMVKQGILFSNVLYIQFSHTETDIQDTINSSDKAFKFVKDNINNIESVLEGKKSIDIFRKNT
ncbi:aspartate aminotransferase family protein [Candidatus Pacearchaeota archaeon]|nr:aspartate aminotransferase family protein [Candidatus Pacearchaeota archaeon]